MQDLGRHARVLKTGGSFVYTVEASVEFSSQPVCQGAVVVRRLLQSWDYKSFSVVSAFVENNGTYRAIEVASCSFEDAIGPIKDVVTALIALIPNADIVRIELSAKTYFSEAENFFAKAQGDRTIVLPEQSVDFYNSGNDPVPLPDEIARHLVETIKNNNASCLLQFRNALISPDQFKTLNVHNLDLINCGHSTGSLRAILRHTDFYKGASTDSWWRGRTEQPASQLAPAAGSKKKGQTQHPECYSDL